MPYSTNVFVNCPFDSNYRILLDPLLFTIITLGFTPRISETSSSGSIRVENLKRHILNSKFSIHDLSRCEPLRAKDLPRFNMPFELGLDLGCQAFRIGRIFKGKKCLILEKKQYRYQKILSDISGQDISAHGNKPQELIFKVRNWFSSALKRNLISASKIWIHYNEFLVDFSIQMKEKGFNKRDIKNLPKSNLIIYMKNWVKGKN